MPRPSTRRERLSFSVSQVGSVARRGGLPPLQDPEGFPAPERAVWLPDDDPIWEGNPYWRGKCDPEKIWKKMKTKKFVCFCFACVVLIATAIAVVETWPPPPPLPLGPETGSDRWAWGYNASNATLFGAGHWCNASPPLEAWSLATMCSPGLPDFEDDEVKVMTYNMRDQDPDAAAHVITHASRGVMYYDVIGLQEGPGEEDDMKRIMKAATLDRLYDYVRGQYKEYIIWNRHRWQYVAKGQANLAEDRDASESAPRDDVGYFGRRNGVWLRIRSLKTRRTLTFVTLHGPLPENTGGLCGEEALAYAILRMVGYHAIHDDSIILAGDFNTGNNSQTVKILDRYMNRVLSGSTYGAVDHIYTQCVNQTGMVLENHPSNGSGHDPLVAYMRLTF